MQDISAGPVMRLAPAGAGGDDRGCADADFVATARRLTAGLHDANRALYWGDLCASVAVGYAAFAVAAWCTVLPVRLASGIIAVLALYRALLFIHELMHLRPGAVPGFWSVWNALIGVPLLAPTFMYEDVHRLHHSKVYYGTKDDPEYLPRIGLPAVMRLLVGSLFVPPLLLLRFAIIAPLAAVFPAVRRLMVERMSSLIVNPAFRRPPPVRAVGQWIALETAGVL